MTVLKLLFVSIIVFCSAALQSAQDCLTQEEVSQLWSNVHSEGIKYFNTMNNTYLRNAVLDNDEDLVADLLRNGRSITISDDHNATPWFYAVAKNNRNIMKLFLDHGARLDMQDVHGFTPLHFAVKKDDTDTVELLQKYIGNDTINLKDDKGRTILFYVQSIEMLKLLKCLNLIENSNTQDNKGLTPLHYLVGSCAPFEMIKFVIESLEVDLTIKDFHDLTASDYALNKEIKMMLEEKSLELL